MLKYFMTPPKILATTLNTINSSCNVKLSLEVTWKKSVHAFDVSIYLVGG